MSKDVGAPIASLNLPPLAARCKEAFDRFWRRESSKTSRLSRVYEGDVYRREAWRAWQIAWTAALDAANSLNAQFLLRPSTESGQLARAVGSSAPDSADKPRTLPSTKGSEGEARGNLAHGSAPYPARVIDFEETVYDVQVLDSETHPARVNLADTIGCEGMVDGDDPLCAAPAGFFITLPDSNSASNGVYVCRGHLESDFKTEVGGRIELPAARR